MHSRISRSIKILAPWLGGIAGALSPILAFVTLFAPIYDVGMYLLLPPVMVVSAIIGCLGGFALRGPKTKPENA